MGRPLRHLEPGSFYFVTTRCLESRFFLRPDPELRAQSGAWLARALERSPGITLYGFLAMSNHLHMVLRDECGELPSFMHYYLGNLARSVNALRGRSGPVFHRRYDATRILDPRSAVRYLAYLISNPVRAGLVKRHEQWPGLLLFARKTRKRFDFSWVDRRAYRAAVQRRAAVGGPRPSRSAHEKHASVVVHSLPFALPGKSPTLLGGRELLSLDATSRSILACIKDMPLVMKPGKVHHGFVSATEAAYQEARETERKVRATGVRAIGVKAVLGQDPLRLPENSKRSPRPLALCDATSADVWHIFRRAWRVFRDWYRQASIAFRAGDRLAQYPPFSMRPGGVPVMGPVR
jgi:REP element-mobilizing transposase RayT